MVKVGMRLAIVTIGRYAMDADARRRAADCFNAYRNTDQSYEDFLRVVADAVAQAVQTARAEERATAGITERDLRRCLSEQAEEIARPKNGWTVARKLLTALDRVAPQNGLRRITEGGLFRCNWCNAPGPDHHDCAWLEIRHWLNRDPEITALRAAAPLPAEEGEGR